MPVPAIDLIKKLMAKAGVTHDGELTADIPDEVATALDNQLLTIAAATNNHPLIKKHYAAQAFNGVDAELQLLIDEYNLPDDVVAEIVKAGTVEGKTGNPIGTSTTKKMVAFVRKIKELGEKAIPADKSKAAELQAEVHKLHTQLAAEIAKQIEIKTGYDKEIKDIRIQTKLSSLLGSHKTVFDELDPVAKEAGINAIITKALQDSDAEFTFDDKGNLSLIKKDGTNLFGDNHTLVTPTAFIDKSLSKILKVTPQPVLNGKNTPAAPPLPGQQQNSPNPALKAALAENLAAYEAAQKQSIAV